MEYLFRVVDSKGTSSISAERQTQRLSSGAFRNPIRRLQLEAYVIRPLNLVAGRNN